MPYQAGGSLLYVNGTVVGSQLIGQNFGSPGYFSVRPLAGDYNASNLEQRVAKVRSENNLPVNASVPAGLVLASGSGLDPHISVEWAIYYGLLAVLR